MPAIGRPMVYAHSLSVVIMHSVDKYIVPCRLVTLRSCHVTLLRGKF